MNRRCAVDIEPFRARLALIAALALTSGIAQACGPYFPPELLSDRARTLAELPEGSFDFEAAHLVAAPTDGFKAIETEYVENPDAPTLRETIERAQLGERYEQVARMRAAHDADAAFAIGEGLPSEVRNYTSGVVAFNGSDVDDAARRFGEALGVSDPQIRIYAPWSAFMLGRAHARAGDAKSAAVAFQRTRALVAAGADDPLGVAVGSFGEEAKLALDAQDDAAAVALYAAQAAHGSTSGRASLLQVARALIRDDARLERALADPLAQRLVTAYLLTRSGELEPPSSDDNAATSDASATTPSPAALDRITRFLGAVERTGLDHVAGADRVAALAYRSGRYDLAARLAAKDTSGVSAWVRAKLALRDGKQDVAAQAYAEAAKSFPRDEEWGTASEVVSVDGWEAFKPACRIAAERGTLALARDEYAQALEHLYDASPAYWRDAAYVAERVVTVDELKAFVDARVSAVATPKPAPTPEGAEADTGPGGETIPADRATLLRALLARRLLRAERYDDALLYFDDAALRAKAQAYADARRGATRGDRIERAQAWYAAAVAARVDGIDLIGYELDPDYQYEGGEFDLNYEGGYVSEKAVEGEQSYDVSKPRHPRLDIVVPSALSTDGERARVVASRAEPLERFHYRYVAADFAEHAADLVPARSQAFAAMLCHATGWLIDRNEARAAQLYQRYVRQGAYVPWAADFGRDCPEPDFVGAAKRLHDERIALARHYARRSLPWVAGVFILAIGAALLIARRRRNRP